ncbi:AAA family ATPase [Pseudoxanthomonas indica]|uniref:DNA repair exonuclease SbcCD ATPase subunit n=1 Tax=Pseudoxanthomonas indica TaxID=428993 RepID=A0A1T5K9P3_9GAMM|nr:AAA family ATPase [Pseudoxanthomonas indica]GGD47714.1 hypothetical protein GCM10007235_19530 [Pseudoxanthomonas indica]SKC60330.1 DNA repair exonuclease SbcCD ATPase subunit [Pseudoxanthomonas indica]
MAVLVDNLSVAAFGGIRTSLDLDLTAPLTLIYAPNGTGKTSLIESIDWLYGGDIREARCKVASNLEPTKVAISAVIGSKPVSAMRAIDSGRSSRVSNGAQVGEAEFLQSLAPDCDVSELSAISRIPKLKAYLSSNHVLGVGALGRLIDSENADARADAMADLAGTRIQRNAQKVMDLYRKKLLERRARLESELSRFIELEEQYLKLSKDRADIDALVKEASRLLVGSDQDVADFERLTIVANRELEDLRVRMESLSELRSVLTLLSTFDKPDHSMQISSLEDEIRDLSSSLRRDNEQSVETSRQNDLLAAEVADLKKLGDALLDLNAVCGDTETLHEARLAASSLASFSSIEVAANRLEALAVTPSEFLHDTSTLRDLQLRSNEIQKLLVEMRSEDQLQAEVIAKERSISESATTRRALSTLRSDAVRIAMLAHQHDGQGTSCPSCGHDWVTRSQLEQAFQDSLQQMPHAEAHLLVSEASLLSDVELLRSEIASQRFRREELQKADAEIEIHLKRISDANALARRFGLDSAASISHETIQQAQRNLRVAEKLAVVDQLYSTHSDWKAIPESTTPASAAKIAAIAAASAHSKLLRSEHSLEALGASIEQDSASISEREGVLRSLRESVAVHESLRSKLQVLQSHLGLNLTTSAHLKEVDDQLVLRQKDVRAALEHLRAAGDIQGKTALGLEAEKASIAAGALAKDIESLDAELIRVHRVHSQVEKQAEHHRERLVATVGPSVSQLFQRMQVNRVFDSVSVGPSFELEGLLGRFSLQPELFSTGQRQDLALAFFLVRAFAMGGSFFLDEPLAHLDDVNRVAVLDTLRSFVLSGRDSTQRTRLVLTTASWTTTRHVIQKFMKVQDEETLLRAYQLTGNVSTNVSLVELA